MLFVIFCYFYTLIMLIYFLLKGTKLQVNLDVKMLPSRAQKPRLQFYIEIYLRGFNLE